MFSKNPTIEEICTGEILKVWEYRKARAIDHQIWDWDHGKNDLYLYMRKWFESQNRRIDNHITFLVRRPTGHVIALWLHDGSVWWSLPEKVIVGDW